MLGEKKGWSYDPDECVRVSKDDLYYPLQFLTLFFSKLTKISHWENVIMLPLPSDCYGCMILCDKKKKKNLLPSYMCVYLFVGTEPFMASDV